MVHHCIAVDQLNALFYLATRSHMQFCALYIANYSYALE